MWFKVFCLMLTIVLSLSISAFSQEVRVVYFQPKGSGPLNLKPIDGQLNILVEKVREFFRSEVGQTFEVERENGKTKVHYLLGNEDFSAYREGTNLNAEKIRDEIINSRTYSANYLYLIFANITVPGVNSPVGQTCGTANYLVEPSWWSRLWGKEAIDSPWAIVDVSAGCFGKPIGVQNVSPDEWKLRVWITAHELGHAFGLQHDFFRPLSHTYVMSYGRDPHPGDKFSVPTQLSPCTKEWLKASRFFNPKTRPPDKETEIFLREVFYSPESENLRLEFTATDAVGLHEAQLFLSDDIFLASCVSLNNALVHIGKFDISGLPEKLYNAFRDEVRIQVIDSYGYIIRKEFSLPRKPQEFPKTASDLVLESLTVQSNTSDQHTEIEPTQDARLRATLKGHTDFVTSIAFSHNGSRLVSGSWDDSIRLWDTNTLETLAEGWHSHDVTSVTFSPDGLRIASGGRDEVIRIWNSNATTMGRTYTSDYLGAFTSVVFIHYPDTDYYRVAAANELDGGIDYFNYYDGNTFFSSAWYGIGTHPTSSLAVSPDQRMIASGGAKLDTNVALWDPYNKKLLKTLKGHTDFITSVAFSPDSRTLASGSWDNTVRLWNIADGKLITTLRGHTDRVLAVAFSPDGRTLASGGDDQTIRLWDITTGRQKDTLLGHTSGVTSLAFNPNRITYMLASAGGWDNTVRLWDLSPAPTPAPTVSIAPSPVVSPTVGKEFVIKVDIAGVQDVAGYQATVHFDPTALRYVESANGSYLPTGTLFVPPVVSANQVTLAATSLSGDSDGAGTLATLTFEVVAVKPSQITLSDVMIMKQDLTSIPIIVKGGDVVVLSEEALDVNGDGIVDILDLTIVATHFGKIGENQADVNGDGIVDIKDLLLVAGAINADAAAPPMYSMAISTLTMEEIQMWLSQAQQLDLSDANYQRGFAVLHQLLIAVTPKETALLPNYPNPFNPETWIPYQLSEPADVTVTIYAVDGTAVRTLALGHQPIGIYQDKSRAVYWDGRNALGERVASGVYFYTLTAGEFTATRKMLIRK